MKGDGRIFRPAKHAASCTREMRPCSCPSHPNWHIAYWGPKGDGKDGEHRESAHSPDERVAHRLLRSRLAEVANHRAGRAPFIGPKKERATVRDLLAVLIRNYEVRRLPSLPQAKNSVRHLNQHLGDFRATAVNRDVFNRYVGWRRAEGASDTTIDRETEKLGRAFALAVEDHQLAAKPTFQKLVKPNANAREGFFEAAVIDDVLARVEHEDARDFLAWFRWTGMRPKEIRSLTWLAFDRDTWTVRLAHRDAKTGRGRQFPLVGQWREIIEHRVARRRLDCDLIFHFDGRKMPNLARRWKAACEGAGVEGRVMYDLRRTAVRDMIRAGVSEHVAMLISGHRTRSVFQRYDITSERDLAMAGEKLTVFLEGLPKDPLAGVKRFPESETPPGSLGKGS
jgi:integrase